jgi:hypothetical protein
VGTHRIETKDTTVFFFFFGYLRSIMEMYKDNIHAEVMCAGCVKTS